MQTIWGYARRSSDYEAQKESLIRQAARIAERVKCLIAGDQNLRWGRLFSETASATKTAYCDRKEFRLLLQEMQKGDILIIENLQRLDRGVFRLVAALERLRVMKIKLILIDTPIFKDGIQLDAPDGQLFLMAMSVANMIWGHAQSAGRKRCLAKLAAEGHPHTASPPVGFRWEDDDNGRSMWVPDPRYQALVREIVLRRHGGWYASPGVQESFADIGYDFCDRHETIPFHRGKTNYGRSSPNSRKRLNFADIVTPGRGYGQTVDTSKIRRCYRKYVRDFLDGKEFGERISDILLLHPERRREIEWLRTVLSEKDALPRPKKNGKPRPVPNEDEEISGDFS